MMATICQDGSDRSSWFVPLSDYVKVMKSFVPKHLAKRFRKLVEMFNKADSGPRSDPLSTDFVGLAHGIFQPAQDAADMLLVLFRRLRLDASPDELSPNFDVEASLVYRIR